MTHHRTIQRLFGDALPMLLCVLCASTTATAAQPTDDAQPAKPEDGAAPATDGDAPDGDRSDDDRKLGAEERAALKAELKREIVAELAQAQQQRDAQRAAVAEAARRAEVARQKAAQLADAKRAAAWRRRALTAPFHAPTRAEQGPASKKRAVARDNIHFNPGAGLRIESEDGDFALNIGLRVQLRYTINIDESELPLNHVFQLRRARASFKGHAFGKHNKFAVQLAFSPRDLDVKDGVPQKTPLFDWAIELDHLRDLTFRAGQYKVPFSREFLMSSSILPLMERSISHSEFSHDRDIGFNFQSKDLGGYGGYLQYYAGVFMGEGRDFGDKNATPDFKLHYVARVEVLPMGKFKQYSISDLSHQTKPRLGLGVAYSFHDEAQHVRGVSGPSPEGGGTIDYHSVTADYIFKYAGFSTAGDIQWRQDSRNDAFSSPARAARNGFGGYVQAGYALSSIPVEFAARYSAVVGIGEVDPGGLGDTDDFTTLTGLQSLGLGMSYYFAGHPWKLQADYAHTWNPKGFDISIDAIRTQLQLTL